MLTTLVLAFRVHLSIFKFLQLTDFRDKSFRLSGVQDFTGFSAIRSILWKLAVENNVVFGVVTSCNYKDMWHFNRLYIKRWFLETYRRTIYCCLDEYFTSIKKTSNSYRYKLSRNVVPRKRNIISIISSFYFKVTPC